MVNTGHFSVEAAKPLSRAKDEEILVEQERVLHRQPEAVGVHFLQQVVPANPHLHRQVDRGLLLLEINHHHLPARLEHLLHQGEIAGVALDVMPRFADKEPVDGGVCQQRVVRRGKARPTPEAR